MRMRLPPWVIWILSAVVFGLGWGIIVGVVLVCFAK